MQRYLKYCRRSCRFFVENKILVLLSYSQIKHSEDVESKVSIGDLIQQRLYHLYTLCGWVNKSAYVWRSLSMHTLLLL